MVPAVSACKMSVESGAVENGSEMTLQNVFLNNPSPNSIWIRFESSALQGVNLNFHAPMSIPGSLPSNHINTVPLIIQ